MGVRSFVEQTVHAALRMVDVAGSTLDDAKGILLELLVDDGDSAQTEQGEYWGVAGLQARPKAGAEGEGYAKALRWRVGDATFVLAGFDPRHAEEVAEGEVVLHSLGKDGSTRALVRLKPDGTVEIEGDVIKIGGSGATQAIALGDLLQTFLNVFWPPADGGSWTPVPNDGGAALQTALTTAFATGRPTVASAKHKVEP